MAPGTVLWNGGDVPGCHTTKIMPAVPTANGPDVFEQSECPDGIYIRAFTAQGIALWRRKIGSVRSKLERPEASPTAAIPFNPLDTHPGSICDSVLVGLKSEGVRQLAKTRNLSVPESVETVWVLEEAGVECRLWFSKNGEVVKKRKILIRE